MANSSSPLSSPLSRRGLLQGAACASAALLPWRGKGVVAAEAAPSSLRAGMALEGVQVKFYATGLSRTSKLLFLADTHLFRDDERGVPYQEYSGRMAKAYNRTRHFLSQEETNPERCFEETLEIARKAEVDLCVLAGDILSFPSEAGVEWVMERLERSGLPWIYTAGNHDWHYEGMKGSSAELRATWIEKRLRPLYQGRDPRNTAAEVGGVRVIALDNSTYEISPEQLGFFREQVATGEPLLLCVHIPLYAAGRPVGFGCGHPQWGRETDRHYQIERRPPWPERHSETTMRFHEEVFAAPNLLGILAGHIHRPSLDLRQGIPQIVTEANARGGHLLVELLPAPDA